MDERRLYGGESDATKRNAIAKEIAQIYIDKLNEIGAVASGELVDSVKNWKFVWSEDKSSLKLVFVLPKYWRQIEQGRPPTKQSQGGALRPAIEKWWHEKGLTLKAQDGKIPTLDEVIDSIVWKIHRYGFYSKRNGTTYEKFHGKYPFKQTKEEAVSNGLVDRLATSIIDNHKEVVHTIIGEIYS